jgi:hypothetical protein
LGRVTPGGSLRAKLLVDFRIYLALGASAPEFFLL